jgi:hypothetical protein
VPLVVAVCQTQVEGVEEGLEEGEVLLFGMEHHLSLQLALLVLEDAHEHVYVAFWRTAAQPLFQLLLVVLAESHWLEVDDGIFNAKPSIIKQLVILP